MEKGDRVKTIDGSYAVRVDSFEKYSSIGLCEDIFEIVQTNRCDFLKSSHLKVHDIIIKNTNTGAMYLHSEAFVRLVKPKVKEVTMAQVEAAFNCKVKIIK